MKNKTHREITARAALLRTVNERYGQRLMAELLDRVLNADDVIEPDDPSRVLNRIGTS